MTLLRINNRILKKNGIVLAGPTFPPAPYTIRLKFTEGVTPTFSKGTGVQVSSSPNIWDLTYENTDWSNLLNGQSDLIEVIDANTTGVTDMSYMFAYCEALTAVPLFDTSNVTNMDSMFHWCEALTAVPLFNTSNVTNMRSMLYVCASLTSVPLFDTSNVTNMRWVCTSCRSLTTVPLFDTSNVTDMSYMFQGCTSVQSGALALYQQASSQATPPYHDYTFTDCGIDTVTGAAELAQIPRRWGGTMS